MKAVKMSLGNVQGKLSRNEMKSIMAGNPDEDDDTGEGGCIKDGKSCGIFTNCCNECLATFKCGKP